MALLPGCVGYLAGVEPVTARVLAAASDLQVISRNGIGVDNIDLEAARRRKVRICAAPGANARGVAELTIGLILSLARAIPFGDHALKQGSWQRRKGFELEGKTLGLVGCGRIGQLVARMAVGIGMNVIAHDVAPDEAFDPGGSFRFVPFEEVVKQSHVISLHCPPAADGVPLIDGDVLKQTRLGVYLVNTARHNLIDDRALAEHLQSGHVAGAAVDVFATEPPADHTLVRSDRVVATPHIGGCTTESIERAVETAVDNLLDALRR